MRMTMTTIAAIVGLDYSNLHNQGQGHKDTVAAIANVDDEEDDDDDNDNRSHHQIGC